MCGLSDVCATTTEEQRRTEWMITESLADFLDPEDNSKTLEGYPGAGARGDYCQQT
ncbi:tRNA (mo5U34)-methyltransferase [Raoultella ornithinolytica]|nr:tRNA (mo5U34)-methyltransferase [Raoultella ornithinolytica]